MVFELLAMGAIGALIGWWIAILVGWWIATPKKERPYEPHHYGAREREPGRWYPNPDAHDDDWM